MLVLPQNVIESLAEFVMVIMLVMELVVSMISLLYWNGQLVCTPASTGLFVCLASCVQVIPAYPPGGHTSAGS